MKSGKKIILAVNKIDNEKRKQDIYSFYELGFDNIIPISGEWESGAIGLRGRNAYGTQKWYSQITYSNIEQKITHDFTDEEINNTSIVELYCTASGVFNNYKFKIMMVAGDIVDKDFEKFTFGASPNPNYPQKINSSGDNGSITEKITNKDLFNKKYL